MKNLLPFLFLPIFGFSQISMNATGSYTQDFNTLVNTGNNNPWTDNSTIPSWFSQKSTVGPIVYDASPGTSNTGKVYSFGSSASPERALGSVGSGSIGNIAHGVLLENTSGKIINDLSVSYTMEQWRDGGALTTPAAQSLRVFYQISNSPISALTPNSNGGWTEVTGLVSISPVFSATPTALDGNLPGNQVVLSNVSIPNLSLFEGQYIMIKWDDPNHTDNDHGLSIDDVTIDWTVSCNTSKAYAVTSCGNFIVPSGDETYSGSGIYYDTIPNTGLCDSILIIDLSIATPAVYYVDADNDTYGDGSDPGTNFCVNPGVGYSTNNQDCNDGASAVNPVATEICDSQDNDCDGFVDEGVATTNYYVDADNDGYGTGSAIPYCSNPGTGYSTNDQDCNDAASAIHPGATEICDSEDNDCDGFVDEGVATTNYYVDADNDGYGTGIAIPYCSNPGTGYSSNNQDCNDGNNLIHPGATEIANNGIDENCDGTDNYLGVAENGSSTISIHPNPSEGIFYINLNENSESAIITCTDLNGKIIFTETLSSSSTIIDLSLVQKGTYLLKISTDNISSIKRISVIH